MLSGHIGLLHFITSLIALATGTYVLAIAKGSKKHKQIGYVYAVSMLILLATSFMLYNLHGSFGILHWFSVISSLTLLGGMVPIWLKKPKKTYLHYHFSFMYWSVIGLYSAFLAEILTRLPPLFGVSDNLMPVLYTLVGLAAAVVGGIGSVYFKKYKNRWLAIVEGAKTMV